MTTGREWPIVRAQEIQAMSEQHYACMNTDRELYRERAPDPPGAYYANSVHVTREGAIGMNVGGLVVVLPIAEWHRRALKNTT